MQNTPIAWSDGRWINPPVSAVERDGCLMVEAAGDTDFWRRTVYGFDADTGHALVTGWDDGRAMQVTFDIAGMAHLYDQVGLILRAGPTQWIKAGIEMIGGVPHFMSVVTAEASDASLFPFTGGISERVTVRMSRLADSVTIRIGTGETTWSYLRFARFSTTPAATAGPFVCAPKAVGLTVGLVRWQFCEPDGGLAPDDPRAE
jgi:uncharacterized protein